ncbi:MAG: anthranilate synthase component I family protein [Saprospiraceae bacterium]|nr:anthranilate synthase component I family protein [Saprospiraceae bacterium]
MLSSFPIDAIDVWKQKLLHWSASQNPCVYMDSNQAASGDWECLVAVGAKFVLSAQAGSAFQQLSTWRQNNPGWLFGFLSYDLKNEVERLHSNHFDGIELPDLYFFQPEIVVGIRQQHLDIYTDENTDPEAVFKEIQFQIFSPESLEKTQDVRLLPRISKDDHLKTVERIRQHIMAGDVYELNFCQEFYAAQVKINPLSTFRRLNALARPPFAVYLRCEGKYLMSASPERFLRKRGQMLLSQPIKGTRRRSANPTEDEAIKSELATNPKDRAENVMIVDLVRNDLARHCEPGSVKVDELFGIYTFPTVHQMISTVSGRLPDGDSGLDALRDAFPMGSMTGAPKVMAMELIEQYEHTRRGLYSGAVGYFDPEGNYDFNVVIRSILYHEKSQYVSVQVGGAIVYDSVPEMEYEECLVKLSAMQKALGNS